MLSIEIRNPEIDAVAAVLIEQGFAAITSQWEDLLPAKIKIILSKDPLSQLEEL